MSNSKDNMFWDLEESWKKLLEVELQKEYFKNIEKFLDSEISAGKTIYPARENIFAAFEYTPVRKLKVVILGQDPYHGPNQAHGLSFSVQEWIKIPPSLKNIYKELENEWFPSPLRRGIGGEVSWNLNHWAEQWVLLLNSILTVEAKTPTSHAHIWWSDFTDTVLQKISVSCDWIIFVFWWNFAQNKKVLIDTNKHFILESAHPSPFSAHRGFFWNGHFKKINQLLQKQWKKEVIW